MIDRASNAVSRLLSTYRFNPQSGNVEVRTSAARMSLLAWRSDDPEHSV
jgi:hypothetical protein